MIRTVRKVSGSRRVKRLLFRAAAWRRRAIVLLYHDVANERPGRERVVEPISPDRLRAHLEALAAVGEIVPLSHLLAPGQAGGRPRFAVTFDDDSATYASDALPILRELGVPATFFLSGRALNGLGPNWWDVLDWWIARDGLDAVHRLLDSPRLGPRPLAAWCEGRESVIRRLLDASPPDAALDRLLAPDGIREIAVAGFQIGFHTLHHPVLPALAPADLERALLEGREVLEKVVGEPITLLSYPHGRADARVAAAAARAGYQAAFGSRGRPIAAAADRFRLQRWEPGPIDVDTLHAELAWRLHRPLS